MRQFQATNRKTIPRVSVLLLLAAQLVLSSSYADHCDGEYGVCKDQAQAKRDLRMAEAAEYGAGGALIVAVGCGLGCIAAGPAYPVCVAACVSVAGSAAALVIADEVRAAHDGYRRDLDNCISARRSCIDSHAEPSAMLIFERNEEKFSYVAEQ